MVTRCHVRPLYGSFHFNKTTSTSHLTSHNLLHTQSHPFQPPFSSRRVNPIYDPSPLFDAYHVPDEFSLSADTSTLKRCATGSSGSGQGQALTARPCQLGLDIFPASHP